MACPTCRREDVMDSCGSRLGEPCKCCGMVIIATAESSEDGDENHNHEEREGSDSDNTQKHGNYLTRN